MPALIKGSLGWTKAKCGYPRCKCAKGELHTACYLSYRVTGKTHTVHIPKVLVKKVERYCWKWNIHKGALEQQTHELVTDLLRKYRKERKTK